MLEWLNRKQRLPLFTVLACSPPPWLISSYTIKLRWTKPNRSVIVVLCKTHKSHLCNGITTICPIPSCMLQRYTTDISKYVYTFSNTYTVPWRLFRTEMRSETKICFYLCVSKYAFNPSPSLLALLRNKRDANVFWNVRWGNIHTEFARLLYAKVSHPRVFSDNDRRHIIN